MTGNKSPHTMSERKLHNRVSTMAVSARLRPRRRPSCRWISNSAQPPSTKAGTAVRQQNKSDAVASTRLAFALRLVVLVSGDG